MAEPIQNTPSPKETQPIKIGGKTWTLSDKTILIAIVILAVVLRLASALYQGNTVSDLPGIYDQISYDGLARRVADGFGFNFAEGHWPATRAGEPTAHWSYFYTLYLATIYKIFGETPVVARILQAIIAGILQTLLIWRIGTRLFGRTVGLIAAAWNTVYIYFFYYAGALITETFYIIGILWMFDAAFRLADSREENKYIHWWRWLELGLAIGVTILLRQVFLLFLPFLYIWLWWNLRDEDTASIWKQRLHWSAVKGLLIATLVFTMMILPFTIRNYRAFNTFVLLNTNAGFAFFWGNHPVQGTSFMPLLAKEQYYDLLPKNLLPLNEAKLDKALLGLGIQFIMEDPIRFILLSISRIEEFIKFWPSSDSGFISNISRVGSFGISLPFAIVGLFVALVQVWKTQTINQRSKVVLLLLFILVYTTIHLLTWALIRYRLPVDAVLIIFAALGLHTLISKFFKYSPETKRDV